MTPAFLWIIADGHGLKRIALAAGEALLIGAQWS
jgi:hypothetical protein